jgi:predicted aspartyl protease
MKYRYGTRFDRPAPVVPVRLRARAGAPFERVEALIDTGADICAVPRAVVEMLDFSPVRVVRVAGVFGQSDAVVYRADFELDGSLFAKVETLATDRPYAIVGRNVQRRLKLVLDGPRSQLDVRMQRQ